MIEFNSNNGLFVGTHVSIAIKKAIEIARENNEDVNFSFNGTNFVINPDSTEEEALKMYNDLCNTEYVKWKNSEDGIRQQSEIDERIKREKETLRKLLYNPPNFSDEVSILDWLLEVEKCYSTHVYKNEVVLLFEKNGFLPNVNCGKDFNENDKNNVFRWLVGQALSGLELVGAIHQMFPEFVKEFKEKYQN